MTLIIGLTGSIATGKSTVSKMFTNLNIPVIDADKIARIVVEPGYDAHIRVVDYFGEDILSKDGTIDRPKLGKIIFANTKKRDALNDIVHPAVRKEMLRQRDDLVKQEHKYIVLDIPLLFESKLTHLVDKTIVVYTDVVIQIERLMKRNNFSSEEAMERIQSQMSINDKTELADVVIDNNGTKAESLAQLKKILNDWSRID